MIISKDYYKLKNQENYTQNHFIILNIHKYLNYIDLQKNIYQTYTNLSPNRKLNLNREEIYLSNKSKITHMINLNNSIIPMIVLRLNHKMLRK